MARRRHIRYLDYHIILFNRRRVPANTVVKRRNLTWLLYLACVPMALLVSALLLEFLHMMLD